MIKWVIVVLLYMFCCHCYAKMMKIKFWYSFFFITGAITIPPGIAFIAYYSK